MDWQIGTLIKSELVGRNVKSLVFSVPGWTRHEAGQFYDVRLFGETKSVNERNYSVASAPETENIVELGVELLDGGKLSPKLFELKTGDMVELRGPSGKFFNWTSKMPGPLLLVAGGSGIVPCMSMLRHHCNNRIDREIILLFSIKSPEDFLYRAELEEYGKRDTSFKLQVTYTQQAPVGWGGYARRVEKGMLKEVFGSHLESTAPIYVCGSTGFVETVTQNLLVRGVEMDRVQAERFGGAKYE